MTDYPRHDTDRLSTAEISAALEAHGETPDFSGAETREECLACGGDWDRGGCVCAWCTLGTMTGAQRGAWASRPRTSPPPSAA